MASTERLILEGDRGTQLEQAFHTVAEADLGKGPKYGPAVVRDLSRIVSSRTYSKPLLEVCHLIRVAEAVGGRHGWPALVFSLPVAAASGFRNRIEAAPARVVAFQEGPGQDFRLGSGGVSILYPDGAFEVSYSRMPLLTALVEFMVTALGYRDVSKVLTRMLDRAFEAKSASDAANELSRLLYDHLKDQLPSVQALKVFRRLLSFMETRGGKGFSLDDINDVAVWQYWLGADEDENGSNEARTFRAATEHMARLRTALKIGAERQELARTRSIGSDREVGEVDPADIVEDLNAASENQDPVKRLAEAPASRIKILNGREVQEFDLLSELGDEALALPLSVLRCQTLGQAQGRLTQAVRRKVKGEEFQKLLSLEECQSYQEQVEDWQMLDGRLRRYALAALAALIEAGRAEAGLELLAHLPSLDLSALRQEMAEVQAGNVVRLDRGPTGNLVAALSNRQLVGDEAADLIKEARSALSNLSRTGYSAEEREEVEVQDGFAVAAPLLRDLSARLQSLARMVGSAMQESGPVEAFQTDKAAFSARLGTLYGDQI